MVIIARGITKIKLNELIDYLEVKFFTLNYMWLGLIITLYYTSIVNFTNFKKLSIFIAFSGVIFILWLKNGVQAYNKVHSFKIFDEREKKVKMS